MRILYGVQGTGNGHITRARAMAHALAKHNIDTQFVFTGRPKEKFFDMECFGDYLWRAGLTFATERGKIRILDTLKQNSYLTYVKDVREFPISGYDLIINDFEPVTAWAAKLNNLHSLSISHQAAFHYDIPKVQGHLESRMIMKTFAPTKQHIGLHWHNFSQPILPPIVEPIEHTEAQQDDLILVYLGFEALDEILQFLRPCQDTRFVVYSDVSEPQQHGHIVVKPLSRTEFPKDLQRANGVIANAGFELASECLKLGKKLLVKPLNGQFEQLCNAMALLNLGRGHVMKTLDSDVLAPWLRQPSPKPINFPPVADALAQWLAGGMQEPVETLTEELWRNVNFF